MENKKKGITYQERLEKIGDIKCYMCKNRWNGHICLDDKLGFQLYCEVCDLFIPMGQLFKIFLSLGNSGKVVTETPDKLHKLLDKYSQWSYEAKDHHIHEARLLHSRNPEDIE